MRYFEDFEPGQVSEAGPYVVSREEIIDFARRFDPQPFHLDEEAGRATHFGGLVASGWHTAALSHKLLVEGMLKFAMNSADDGMVGLQVFAGEATRLAYGTEEAQEGRDAFVQKRKRDFKRFPWSY